MPDVRRAQHLRPARAQPQPQPHRFQGRRSQRLAVLLGLPTEEVPLQSPVLGMPGAWSSRGTPDSRHDGFWLLSNTLVEKVTWLL